MEVVKPSIECAHEVYDGLTSSPKYIASKFFYDAKGSEIFRDIMRMPEYYLTDAEAEIFNLHKAVLTTSFCDSCEQIDIVELGAGDGSKTRILLKYLYENNIRFRYVPVDISKESNEKLVDNLKTIFNGIEIEEKTGDYFEMIGQLSQAYSNRKIVMFLGSNLGNYTFTESVDFLIKLSSMMTKNDKLLLGVDLKKDPETIKKAYNDPHGHTKKFNLNLLERFNSELGANFNLENFRHVPVYDPLSGAAKSYLVSTKDQIVCFSEINKEVRFNKWEAIYTEMSQKYDAQMISKLASQSGFQVDENYYDENKFFVNTLWKKL